MPTSDTLLAYFYTWSLEYIANPSKATSCYSLYAASFDSPVAVGQELIVNLPAGSEVAYNLTLDQVKSQLASAPNISFRMSTSTESSDLNSAWTSSSSSAGGTYFYSTSSSQQDNDFTQTFASSTVVIETQYAHFTAIPLSPLTAGSIKDGGQTYQAWFYPGALTEGHLENSKVDLILAES